jgi:hypothetical protein
MTAENRQAHTKIVYSFSCSPSFSISMNREPPRYTPTCGRGRMRVIFHEAFVEAYTRL